MVDHPRRQSTSGTRRLATALAKRWWLVVGVATLVGIGALATAISSSASPPFTEAVTFQIDSVPTGATSYDDSVARSRAELAEQEVASGVTTSSSFLDALTARLSGSGMVVDARSLQGALEAAHMGDVVVLTVHWATKTGAERVTSAALAEIRMEVANGDMTLVSPPGDAVLRVAAPESLPTAVVDVAAQRAAWRSALLRLLAGLGCGLSLVVAAWLWEDRRLGQGEAVTSTGML